MEGKGRRRGQVLGWEGSDGSTVCVCVSLFFFCMANSSQTFSAPRRDGRGLEEEDSLPTLLPTSSPTLSGYPHITPSPLPPVTLLNNGFRHFFVSSIFPHLSLSRPFFSELALFLKSKWIRWHFTSMNACCSLKAAQFHPFLHFMPSFELVTFFLFWFIIT